MTTETKTALQESIESLGTEDFYTHAGDPTDIYLDPEKKVVYVFVGSNSSPMTAHNRIDRHLMTVYNGAIASSVQSAMCSVSDELEELVQCYRGTEWDGHNHIGQWDADAESQLACLREQLSQTSIGCYWDPCDWFGPVEDDLKREWLSGKTSAEIIDGQYLGNDCDGEVDRDESINWLDGMIEEWSNEMTKSAAGSLLKV